MVMCEGTAARCARRGGASKGYHSCVSGGGLAPRMRHALLLWRVPPAWPRSDPSPVPRGPTRPRAWADVSQSSTRVPLRVVCISLSDSPALQPTTDTPRVSGRGPEVR